MKKVVRLMLAVLLLVSFSAAAHADTLGTPAVQAQPATRFTYIQCVIPALAINSSGRATCYGSANLYTASQTVSVTVTLQKSTANGWVDVKSWSDSGPGVPGVEVVGRYYVVSGTYRVRVTAKAYDANGTLLESFSAYSGEVTY